MGRHAHAALVAVYLNVVLYALCFQLQSPVEPYVVERLAEAQGSDATKAYATLQAAFAALQAVGSPLVGALLDRCGPRLAFAAVFASSAASYYLRAHASTLLLLFLSKVPALLQHGFLVAQACVTAVAPPEERPAALGRLMTSYTVGAVIGPALGGALGASAEGAKAGANLAVAGSLVSVALSLALLPDAAAKEEEEGADAKGETEKPRAAGTLAVARATWLQLVVKLLTGCAAAAFSAASPLVYKEAYGLDAKDLGVVMSVNSGVNAVVGAVGLGPLSRALSDATLLRCGTLALAAGFAAVAVAGRAPSHWPLAATAVSLSVVGHALATCLTAQASTLVDPGSRGVLLGLEHGLFSVARIAMPGVGVAALTYLGVTGVAVASAAPALAAAAVVFAFSRARQPKSKQK